MSLTKNSKELEKASLLVLVGPTASGKTELAIRLAQELDGEIISADSLQIYKECNIGSAKPDKRQLSEVKHHLISEISPQKVLNAYEYSVMARKAISNVVLRGKKPILVGGSGLYIRAIVDGLVKLENFSEEVRREIVSEVKAKGLANMYKALCDVDPDAAAAIHINDEFRIVRALELYRVTGKTRKESAKSGEPLKIGSTCFVGLDMERSLLYSRINKRVDVMLDAGLLEETKTLIAKYGYEIHPLKSLGYRQLSAYLRSEINIETARYEIKKDTRHFAKRQLTWFRKDKRITWVKAGEDVDKNFQEAKKVSCFNGI